MSFRKRRQLKNFDKQIKVSYLFLFLVFFSYPFLFCSYCDHTTIITTKNFIIVNYPTTEGKMPTKAERLEAKRIATAAAKKLKAETVVTKATKLSYTSYLPEISSDGDAKERQFALCEHTACKRALIDARKDMATFMSGIDQTSQQHSTGWFIGFDSTHLNALWKKKQQVVNDLQKKIERISNCLNTDNLENAMRSKQQALIKIEVGHARLGFSIESGDALKSLHHQIKQIDCAKFLITRGCGDQILGKDTIFKCYHFKKSTIKFNPGDGSSSSSSSKCEWGCYAHLSLFEQVETMDCDCKRTGRRTFVLSNNSKSQLIRNELYICSRESILQSMQIDACGDGDMSFNIRGHGFGADLARFAVASGAPVTFPSGEVMNYLRTGKNTEETTLCQFRTLGNDKKE